LNRFDIRFNSYCLTWKKGHLMILADDGLPQS